MKFKEAEKIESGWGVYRMYLNFRLHFNSDKYDYSLDTLKGEEIKCKSETYRNREDIKFFKRIVRLYNIQNMEELQGLFISHFVSGAQYNDLYNEKAKETFLEWKKRKQSLTYNFEEDLDVLLQRTDKFDDLFRVVDGVEPEIVKAFYHSDISIETFIIMDKILGFIEHIDKHIDDDIIWPRKKKLCSKYSRLLEVDVNKYKKLLKKRLFNLDK